MHPSGADFGELLAAIQAIETERRPLVERLKQIELNKNATSPEIYQKFRSETEQRLRELDSRAGDKRSEAARVQQQVAAQRRDLEQSLKKLHDELAELRFRNTLGEFPPEVFANTEGEKQKAIDELAAQLKSLAEADELLAPFLDAPSSPPAASDEPTAEAAVAAPPAVGAPPAAPPAAASEMESLFGAGTPASPAVAPPAAPMLPISDEATTQELSRVPAPAVASVAAPPQPAPTEPIQPVLVVRAKDRGEDVYDMATGATLIGRAPENDIILLEESVSRRHARITVDDNRAQVEDLGSANGSYVNGERLRPREPKPLHDNDVLKFGQLMALFKTQRDS